LRRAHSRQKEAEDRVAVPERQTAAAQRQVAHLEGKLEESNELLEAVRAEAGLLPDLTSGSRRRSAATCSD